MKLRCLIVEDEPLARNLMTDYVSKVGYLELVQACATPLAALEVLRNEEIDLMFLDIQMPEITGISLLKSLQKKPLVILTTAYSQYAIESYELDVVDYLLKPITFDRFLKAVDKASLRTQIHPTTTDTDLAEKSPSYVFVKDGTKLVKVFWGDILYIEGLKDYVTIHTRSQKVITLQRMKTLESQLPADQFVRIHHSFIISLKAIDAVHKNEVQIGNAMIPISDSYKKPFRELIEKNQMQ